MESDTVTLSIDGMMCDGCVQRVDRILRRAGLQEPFTVIVGSVSLDRSRSESVEVAISALRQSGYSVTVME
jgi:copper chaperone CopZ